MDPFNFSFQIDFTKKEDKNNNNNLNTGSDLNNNNNNNNNNSKNNSTINYPKNNNNVENNEKSKTQSEEVIQKVQPIKPIESLEIFVENQIRLIGIEKQEEIATFDNLNKAANYKQMELSGICIRKLKIVDTKSGLAGKILVELQIPNKKELPANKFSAGDIVALYSQKTVAIDELQYDGLVYRITDSKVVLALREFFEENNNVQNSDFDREWILFKVGSDIPYQRAKAYENLVYY